MNKEVWALLFFLKIKNCVKKGLIVKYYVSLKLIRF